MSNDEEFPYASLCKVVDGTLVRLADIRDEEIHERNFLPHRNLEWSKSDMFYVPTNFIGIWNWRLSSKYTPFAIFDRERVPTEIIIFKDCKSHEQLARRLINGSLKFSLSTGKALISFVANSVTFYGILCTDEDFDDEGNFKIKLMRIFEFSVDDAFKVEDKIFYSRLTLKAPKYTIDVENLNQLVKKQPVTQKISEANTQIERLKHEINILIKRRAELEQEIEVLQKSREELIAKPEAQTVDRDVDDDFVYAFEDELGIESGTIEKFALYMHAAFDNKIPLLLAGPKAREIVDAFSVALTSKTAAVFDCAAVKSLDDLKALEASDDLIVSLINPLAPDFIAYIPEIVRIKNKFIVALHPFAEDLKLEPRGLYNYFLPVFTELIIDAPTLLRKTIKTLKSNVDGSTELFAEFPFEYVNGRGEKFLKGFKGDGAALDKMRAFMGGDDE